MRVGEVDVPLSSVAVYTAVPAAIIAAVHLVLDEAVLATIAGTPSAVACCAVAVACPILWNGIPKYLRTALFAIFGGRKGAMLAFSAFTVSMSAFRDLLFQRAMDATGPPALVRAVGEDAAAALTTYVGPLLFLYGLILSLSSFARLGIFGTYMGEYFGIMLSEKITSFPFNHVSNPMYFGSTVSHFGKALMAGSPVGLVLSAVTGWAYYMGAAYEEPLMVKFYSENRAKVRVRNGWDIFKKLD